MCTAAELLGEITHGNYSYSIAVLLTEKCLRTSLFSVLNVHDLCHNVKILCYLLIYNSLNSVKLLLSHR